MNQTAQVQGGISLIPYHLTNVGEGEAYRDIIRAHDGDIKSVNHFIEVEKQKLNDFYHNEYVPRGCCENK